MNALIAALVNYMYVTLPKKDFIFWNVFFSELSKSMFGMEILRSVCYFGKDKGEHGHHDHHENHEHETREHDDE